MAFSPAQIPLILVPHTNALKLSTRFRFQMINDDVHRCPDGTVCVALGSGWLKSRGKVMQHHTYSY